MSTSTAQHNKAKENENEKHTQHKRSSVEFSAAQNAALAADERSPRWDLHPPQREEYDCDYGYALGLRQYADRLIVSNAKAQTLPPPTP